MDMRTIIGRFGWAAGIGAAVAVAGVAEGGQLVELPVPPGTQAVDVTGICPTADFVVGYLIVNQSPLAVCWRGGCNGEAKIMYLPDPGGGTSGPSRALACGINDAGQLVIVGDSWSIDQPVAIVWIDGVVAEIVSTGVPFPWGIGFRDCSADGCVRVGVYAGDGPPFMPLGQVCGAPHFIFPMQAPGSIANCVSPDGILVGMERLGNGGWRVYNRNIGDFTTDYDPPPGELSAHPTAILNNGRATGGADRRAVRWFANGNHQLLDQLPGELFARTKGMASNRTVVGTSTDNGLGEIGVVWPGSGTAVVEYEMFLTDHGITVPGDIDFTRVGAISADAKRFGATMMRNGEPYACIAYLEGACDGLEEPACTGIVGDTNGDGVVSFLDISSFAQAIRDGSGANALCADVNEDGQVNLDDVDHFIALLAGDAAPGPVGLNVQAADTRDDCTGLFFELKADLTFGDQLGATSFAIQLDDASYSLIDNPNGGDIPPSTKDLAGDRTLACDDYVTFPNVDPDSAEDLVNVLEVTGDGVSSRAFVAMNGSEFVFQDNDGTTHRFGLDGPAAPLLEFVDLDGGSLGPPSGVQIGTISAELTTYGNAPATNQFEIGIFVPQGCENGIAGFNELALLLGNWGPCSACVWDLDGDGTVGFNDLVMLLGSWGSCF